LAARPAPARIAVAVYAAQKYLPAATIISERTRLFEKGKSFTFKSPAANKVPNRIALIFTNWHEEFLDAGLRGTCLVFFFYIVINCFGSVFAAIA
jgi:hypothetical protein